MDIKVFIKIFRDKHFIDYQKMKYKYGADFGDFLSVLDEAYYETLPLVDFEKKGLVYIKNYAEITQSAIKQLLQVQNQSYGIKAAEEEIIASSAIERIDFSRDSVRRILKGMAPQNEQENRIAGIKKGLDFIADTDNKITEENIYKLYMMTVGDFLSNEEKLSGGNIYRNDTVYVVSDHIEHSGADYKQLPENMKRLVEIAGTDDGINDLIKAAIIHFYIAYIHPYFDGNGRMARLIHLWFLIQKGYRSALFIPFSSQIEKSRKEYYEAFTVVENNKKYSGKIDVTPFILYFTNNVYNKINAENSSEKTFMAFESAMKKGKITEKETQLWQFVLSYYGTQEFSTKQLEKDFGNAAYATIRAFVQKFEELELLSSIKYGARTKYKVLM